MSFYPNPARGAGGELNRGRRNALNWRTILAFSLGFFLEFNVLVGGNGEGAAATGGFGFRVIDFLSAAVLGLLVIRAFAPRRILALLVFSVLVAVLFLTPLLRADQRTDTLTMHYMLYSFAALYVVMLLHDGQTVDSFCWGLVIGLLASIPIFVLQDLGYTSTLMGMGLIPGYFYSVLQTEGDMPRYAGLWGHPNEAGHVSALAAAAGAYLGFFRGRTLALYATAVGLVTVFYYTQTRGALIAAGLVFIVAILFSGSGRVGSWRWVVLLGFVIVGLAAASQTGFITARFEQDSGTAGNFAERLASTLYGFQLVLTHPFGLSAAEFSSLMSSGTGGIATPHNGFIFFAGIFGVLSLAIVVFAFISNVRFRSDDDPFYALLALQIGLSCMFEQMPGSYSYAFLICTIVGRAFVRTPIGKELVRSRATARYRTTPSTPGAPLLGAHVASGSEQRRRLP
jgi:O-antigen ligase